MTGLCVKVDKAGTKLSIFAVFLKQRQKLTYRYKLCQLLSIRQFFANELDSLGRACVGVRPARVRGAALASGHEKNEATAKVDSLVKNWVSNKIDSFGRTCLLLLLYHSRA